MRTSGSSRVALATAYSMILSANSWRARSMALRSSRAWTSVRRAASESNSPEARGEVVVRVGQDLLAQLLERDREVTGLAAQRLLDLLVLGEGHVELADVVRLHPLEVLLEAGQDALLADDHRQAFARAALERLAVDRPLERDRGVVAVLELPVLDRGQRRVLVTQVVDDLVDLAVVDGLDLGPEVEALVVAELDLGADLDGRLEAKGLPLLGLQDLDVGVGERQDPLLDDRLAVGVLDEVVDGVVEDRGGADDPLQDVARRLAGPEPGDPMAAREVRDRLLDLALEALGRELDLELDGALGRGGGRDCHRPGSICTEPEGGRQAGRLGVGGRSRAQRRPR